MAPDAHRDGRQRVRAPAIPWGLLMRLTRLLCGTAMPVLAMAMATPAIAQSTGSEYEETITVTGSVLRSKGGLISNEKVTKTRSTITDDYIETQSAGQSINQTLNLLPGVNFTNNDPYGSSGGNIRLRGFDGPRISQTFDGLPLNDTGNYSLYSNQQVDGEIISRATVNLGTTDVDSPTASATGGTINITTRRPDDELTFRANASVGSFDYRRVYASIDTGEIGTWGTTAFLTGSYQVYDKFKGRGDLEKKQVNAKIYQPLGGDDFISIAGHYNENRNNSYRNGSKEQIAFYGYDYDFNGVCNRDEATAGVADDDGAVLVGNDPRYLSSGDNPINPSACSNYWGVRINPSDTGNIRIQSSFALTDSIRLTVDPSYQYTQANGGSGNTVIAETDTRLIGLSNLAGVDLNGDGDTLDRVRVHFPSNTRTHRYGVTASLIWELDDTNTIRAAYTLDYGRHRQTGEASYLDDRGIPRYDFAGLEGEKIRGADGSVLRNRDRFSIAKLNQFALSYTGLFLDDRLRVNAGVRLPYFERELNQYCYSRDASSNVLCTTSPVTELDNGNVVIPGQSGQYIRPFNGVVREYNEVLPNIGVSYEVADGHIVYASYAKGLSAPRTDNLYTPKREGDTVVLADAAAETTNAFDLGYRFQGDDISLQAALWMTQFENRIVNAYDQDLGFSIFRNMGDVDLKGFDIEVGYQPVEGLTLYASASFIDSEVKNDIVLSPTTALPTAGKELVETPDWTVSGRVQYEVAGFVFGFQGKYVGDRFSTDVNDEIAEAYTVFDADIRYDFAELGSPGTYIQFNALNLFDEEYLGSISSSENALPVEVGGGVIKPALTLPFYNVGAPQTFQVTVGVQF